jgi:hypothetical protein
MYIESEHQARPSRPAARRSRESPQLPIAHWNLGSCSSRVASGTGWEEHEWGLKTNGMRLNREIGGWPEWDGSPGKKVVIYGEQGIGDEIMFASMLPDVLKTNEVVLECHERLVTLFEKSFPGVKSTARASRAIRQWVENETADARIAIGSLGKFYRRSARGLPRHAVPERRAGVRGARSSASASPGRAATSRGACVKRSIPLSVEVDPERAERRVRLAPVHRLPGGARSLMAALGYDIKTDPAVKTHDYYETARLVKSCDLVISVCTSVIHLAGALGVPCWVMTPKNPAWRYQNSGRMPWYRSVRLYRQPVAGEWREVVSRVGLDLDELVASRSLIERVA